MQGKAWYSKRGGEGLKEEGKSSFSDHMHCREGASYKW